MWQQIIRRRLLHGAAAFAIAALLQAVVGTSLSKPMNAIGPHAAPLGPVAPMPAAEPARFGPIRV